MRTINSRLARLEAAASQEDQRPWRTVIGDSEDECQAKARAMIHCGQADELDNFILRIIVDPPAYQ